MKLLSVINSVIVLILINNLSYQVSHRKQNILSFQLVPPSSTLVMSANRGGVTRTC